MLFLSNFRNHESQYLQPLLQKACTVLAARIQPASSLLSIENGKDPAQAAAELQIAEGI